MRLRSLVAIALSSVAVLGGCATAPPPPAPEVHAATVPRPTPVSHTKVTHPLPQGPIAIAVFKERRELVLVRNGTPFAHYPIRLSTRPSGHKLRQGDLRTPEGKYQICQIRPSRFGSFLWVNYPSLMDAQQGLIESRLSREQYLRISEALDSGSCPPFDTPLGGLVGIHGDYEEPPRRYDWTEGCIALTRNEDVMRLASFVRPGTPVVIYP
jgi:murein L,D-transpeptidase YafK